LDSPSFIDLTGGTAAPTRAFRERKLHQGQNLIPYPNRDFRINPDLRVCRIAPKNWIYSLVGVSHFTK